MFNWTHEVIINSLTDKLFTESGLLRIAREGEYKLSNIVDSRIYKTTGTFGKNGKVVVNIVDGGSTIFKTNGVYRLSIMVGMNNKFLSDYAMANWYPFGKPIVVEFEVTTENNNKTALLKLISDSLKEAIPYNNQFALVTTGTDDFTVTLPDKYAHIQNVTIEYYNPSVGTDSNFGEYQLVSTSGKVTITANEEPFGTGEWLQENLRFPSYPNVRYAGMYSDERPRVGELYNQYTFNYNVVRTGLGGLSVVGQTNQSITTHVFYVLASISKAFEDKITEAFGENVIVEKNSIQILSARTVANDNVPVQLKYSIYPENSDVTIKWKLVDSGGSDTTVDNVTLTQEGVLTATTSATASTKFNIKAYSDNHPEYVAVIKEFEVIEG